MDRTRDYVLLEEFITRLPDLLAVVWMTKLVEGNRRKSPLNRHKGRFGRGEERLEAFRDMRLSLGVHVHILDMQEDGAVWPVGDMDFFQCAEMGGKAGVNLSDLRRKIEGKTEG